MTIIPFKAYTSLSLIVIIVMTLAAANLIEHVVRCPGALSSAL